MKRIATIQDISCVGKCSLTVALPIISAMGVETAIIPTAVLSTHTMFSGYTFRDLTSDIRPIIDHWKKEGFSFDAIYTGFLGSREQIDLMKQLISEFRRPSTAVVIDPCMADNGKLYPCFDKDFAAEMSGLCRIADYVLPNLTEAAFLLDRPMLKAPYSEEDIVQLLRQLAALGPKNVILKGIEFTGRQKSVTDVEGKIGIASYDSRTGEVSWFFHNKLKQNFHGTGDIFASVFTGALVRGLSVRQSYALAGEFVEKSIAETICQPEHNSYGVDFETVFPFLIERLGKML